MDKTKLDEKLLAKKWTKTQNKRRPGVNFTNFLRAAFTLLGPKIAKWHCWLDCLFAHLGSRRVKAVRRTLMKLSPGVNFINVLRAVFMHTVSKAQKDSEAISLFWAFGICSHKSCSWNVDEIDPWDQFNQHISTLRKYKYTRSHCFFLPLVICFHNSVSRTKLNRTLPVNTTRS